MSKERQISLWGMPPKSFHNHTDQNYSGPSFIVAARALAFFTTCDAGLSKFTGAVILTRTDDRNNFVKECLIIVVFEVATMGSCL